MNPASSHLLRLDGVHRAACWCWKQPAPTSTHPPRFPEVTPGDATVPRGNRRFRGAPAGSPAWWRWLGLS